MKYVSICTRNEMLATARSHSEGFHVQNLQPLDFINPLFFCWILTDGNRQKLILEFIHHLIDDPTADKLFDITTFVSEHCGSLNTIDLW